MAKQNIYDNEIFFEGYKKIRDNEINANNLFEIPALFSMMPDLTGKTSGLCTSSGTGNAQADTDIVPRSSSPHTD